MIPESEVRRRAWKALTGAADWFATHRWCQVYGALTEDGRTLNLCELENFRYPEDVVAACAAGGLMLHMLPFHPAVFDAAREAIKAVTGRDSIVGWNDYYATGKDQVVEVLRGAAARVLGVAA